MQEDPRELYRSRLARRLGVAPAQVSLFARGRVAFYAVLKALGVRPGDEVVIPAFTCVAVPNAVLYAGATPVWVDVDPLTYTIDPTATEAALTARTRVVLAQNTFGLSAPIEELRAIIGSRGITVVDDCCHGLGGTYRGRPNGTGAPVSFFSTQWSKPISTGLGGFAVARDEGISARLREIEAGAPSPSWFRSALLRSLVFGRDLVGHGSVLRAGRAAYRALSRHGAVPGSSSGEELEGTAMPRSFLSTLSAIQARLGAQRIVHLAAEVQARRTAARRYSDWLSSKGLRAAAEPGTSEHAFLRYPLRVHDKPAFLSASVRAGLDLGDWFVSPIHPVLDRLDRWGYRIGTAPIAEGVCREIVNLPTDPRLTDAQVDRVLGFLAQNVEAIC